MVGFLYSLLIGLTLSTLSFLALGCLVIPLTLLILPRLLFSWEHWKALDHRMLTYISRLWGQTHHLLSPRKTIVETRWLCPPLDPSKSYMVMANHQSWLDILILQKILSSKTSLLIFFFKKQLLWIPFLGLGCWALGYPMMQRHSKKYLEKYPEKRWDDIRATQKSCEKYAKYPITLINFVEGTRFSPAKKKDNTYQHLLSPKAGGLAFSLAVLGDHFHQIIDVTLYYPDSHVTLWNYLCGKLTKIIVEIKTYPITPDLIGDYLGDPAYQQHIRQWINQRWKEKDKRLEVLHHE